MKPENPMQIVKTRMDIIMQVSQCNSDLSDPKTNQTIDHFMVHTITELMTVKLDQARENGRHGWWDRNNLTDTELSNKLDCALEYGDFLSVMNYAAMMLMRQAVLIVENYDKDRLEAIYMGCEFDITLDLTDLRGESRQWYMRVNPIGQGYICDGWIPKEKAENVIDAFMYSCDGAMLPVPTVAEITTAINTFKAEA